MKVCIVGAGAIGGTLGDGTLLLLDVLFDQA